MRVERFKASSLREAMAAIKSRLGEDAVILHSRVNDDNVEIIAAVDEPQKEFGSLLQFEKEKEKDKAGLQRQPLPFVASEKSVQADAETSDAGIYNRMGQSTIKKKEVAMQNIKNGNHDDVTGWEELLDLAVKNDDGKNGRSIPMPDKNEPNRIGRNNVDLLKPDRDEMDALEQARKLWLKSEKRLDSLRQEIAELKEILLRQELSDLKQRAQSLHKEKEDRKPVSTVSPHAERKQRLLGDIRKKLLQKGIPDQIASKMMQQVEGRVESLELNSEAQIQMLKKILAEVIAGFIHVSAPQGDGNNEQRIITFVGPNNAGKSTACLKLALYASTIQEKTAAIILVSPAKERTPEHLALFAANSNLPFAVVKSAPELLSMIRAYEDKDALFVDFALDHETETDLLESFLEAINTAQVHLVLPACQEMDVIEKNIAKFAGTRFSHVLLTHFDSIEKVASVITIGIRAEKPFSFISNGEQIPESLEPANSTKLTHLILKG